MHSNFLRWTSLSELGASRSQTLPASHLHRSLPPFLFQKFFFSFFSARSTFPRFFYNYLSFGAASLRQMTLQRTPRLLISMTFHQPGSDSTKHFVRQPHLEIQFRVRIPLPKIWVCDLNYLTEVKKEWDTFLKLFLSFLNYINKKYSMILLIANRIWTTNLCIVQSDAS